MDKRLTESLHTSASTAIAGLLKLEGVEFSSVLSGDFVFRRLRGGVGLFVRGSDFFDRELSKKRRFLNHVLILAMVTPESSLQGSFFFDFFFVFFHTHNLKRYFVCY